MYLLKLQETDEYQLRNLAGYERLYPPMKYYHKTEIPPEEAEQPQLDPLAMKLWMLDQQMNKNKKKEEKAEQEGPIPGNETDEEQNAYYSTFITVAKSFVADFKVSKIQKPQEPAAGAKSKSLLQPKPLKVPLKKTEGSASKANLKNKTSSVKGGLSVSGSERQQEGPQSVESSSSNGEAWIGNPQMGDNEVELYSYNNMLGGTDDELTEGDDSQPTMKKRTTDLADSEFSSTFQHTNMATRHQVKMRSQQNVHSHDDFARRQQMRLAHGNHNEYFHVHGGNSREQPMSQYHRNLAAKPAMQPIPGHRGPQQHSNYGLIGQPLGMPEGIP